MLVDMLWYYGILLDHKKKIYIHHSVILMQYISLSSAHDMDLRELPAPTETSSKLMFQRYVNAHLIAPWCSKGVGIAGDFRKRSTKVKLLQQLNDRVPPRVPVTTDSKVPAEHEVPRDLLYVC